MTWFPPIIMTPHPSGDVTIDAPLKAKGNVGPINVENIFSKNQ